VISATDPSVKLGVPPGFFATAYARHTTSTVTARSIPVVMKSRTSVSPSVTALYISSANAESAAFSAALTISYMTAAIPSLNMTIADISKEMAHTSDMAIMEKNILRLTFIMETSRHGIKDWERSH
jgi:hypothetical protein